MRNIIWFIVIVLLSNNSWAQNAPSATITPVSKAFCTGLPATFSAVASRGGITYSWSVNPSKGVTQISGINTSAFTVTFNSTLNYTLTLSVSDTGGVSTSTLLVFVSKTPKASFYATLDAVGYPANLLLTNYSTNSNVNYWKYNSVTTIDSSLHTSRTFNSPGEYTVTLIAKGVKGCVDSTTYTFEIPASSMVILPNVFTPNNDGINDLYRPILTGINELQAGIYNRYGVLVYSWDKINGAWDGYTTAGMPCSQGQYYIVLKATGFDGQTYNLKGNVTLIR